MAQRGHLVAHLAEDGLAAVDSGVTALVPRPLDLQAVELDDGSVLAVAHHRRLHHLLEGDLLDGGDEAAAQQIQPDVVGLSRRTASQQRVERRRRRRARA